MRVTRLVAVALAAVAALSACGSSGAPDTVLGSASDGKLTVGIRFDQPGVGFRTLNGDYRGFDVDVARYVAQELGVSADRIEWKEAEPADREKLITSGQVDFVVAAYTINDKRKQQVDFAGPYFSVGQDLLVRQTDTSITGPQSLNGKRLCSVAGSTSAQQVKAKFAQGASLVEYGRYSDCVTALLANIVDAVTTDDVILAGYAAQNPELLKVVNQPFTKDSYGIGLRKGDQDSRVKIDDAVQKMISSGAWQQALQTNLGKSGYKIPDPPKVTER
ncbi:glutamate ABC transporter substrate-binding protein [Kutzneria viridogrisea]|uniref:glutamate ABC transporter substrate-binding protein n=1 Tax=Kutzneria TaxID=43356 RepID=UPI00046D38F1